MYIYTGSTVMPNICADFDQLTDKPRMVLKSLFFLILSKKDYYQLLVCLLIIYILKQPIVQHS